MRQGQNPAKMGLPAYQPKRLGILLLVYIPNQDGFFAESLEIFRYQVASLHRNTPVEFNLFVFDNGSCAEVQEAMRAMQSEGLIDWLTLSSHNMGKAGALNWAIKAMPNELICYSDGDVYFRSGWFEKSLGILEAFPKVGMVTSQPCFFDSLDGKGQAHLALSESAIFELSDCLSNPDAAEEYVRSIGDKLELHTRYSQHHWQVAKNKDVGVDAIVGASPFQFIGYKAMLEQITPLSNATAMKGDRQIFIRMEQLGFLQLSTREAFVYHMGNKLDETAVREIQRDRLGEILAKPVPELNPSQNQASSSKRFALRMLHRFGQISFFKRMIQRIYNLLFEYLAQVKR
jgi:hypothetical protein